MTKYTIGDISRKLNVSNDAVRYYDKEGLLPFAKRNKASSARYVLCSSSKELYVKLNDVEKKDKIVDIYFIGIVIITIAIFIATSFLA